MANDSRVLVNVDDFDSSMLYAGSWTSQDSNDEDYSSTSHTTSDTSSWALLTFNGTQSFILVVCLVVNNKSIGTLVTVYGTLNESSGQSQFTLDNQPPFQFTNDLNTTNSPQYQHPFYTSPLLSYGEHTLNISLLEAGKTLTLDYFQITTTLYSPEASPRPNTPTTISVPSESHSHPNPTSGADTVQTSDSATPHKTGLSGPAIAGIVVGLCILLSTLIILAAFAYKMRWHRRHLIPSVEHDSDILGSGESLWVCCMVLINTMD